MIDNEASIDNATEGGFLLEHERELLKHQAETLRTFYSLTGAPRKDYTIQMAEAEADRIRIVRAAEAQGIIAIRQAEAAGIQMIGDALAATQNPEMILKIFALEAVQKTAQSLADGKATKIFLPQNFGDIFSLLATWQEAFSKKDIVTPSSTQGDVPYPEPTNENAPGT